MIEIPKWLDGKLNQDDCREIKDLITEIEKGTTGEVVPMVVKNSSTTGHTPYIVLFVLIFIDYFSGIWHLSIAPQLLPNEVMLLLHMIVILVLTRLLSSWTPIQRYLTPVADQKYQVEQRAINEFYNHRIHHTQAQTGILIYISLMERMAIVVGDENINDKIFPNDWEKTLNKIISPLKNNDLKKGIINGLNCAKELLSTYFPANGENHNELANDLIIKE